MEKGEIFKKMVIGNYKSKQQKLQIRVFPNTLKLYQPIGGFEYLRCRSSANKPVLLARRQQRLEAKKSFETVTMYVNYCSMQLYFSDNDSNDVE